MVKESPPYLEHILEAIGLIEQFTLNMTSNDFRNDVKTFNAVIRQLEVIGEASSHLVDEFKKSHPEIPWRIIIATRNKLIHEYWNIDPDTIWLILMNNLPELKKQIQAALAKT